MRLVTETAQHKKLKFVLKFEKNLPAWINGDPVRLRQILLNFVSNAAKFTQTGSVTIHVSRTQPSRAAGETGRQEAMNSAQLRFSVIDTGIGISAEAQRRLFQSFTQS